MRCCVPRANAKTIVYVHLMVAFNVHCYQCVFIDPIIALWRQVVQRICQIINIRRVRFGDIVSLRRR